MNAARIRFRLDFHQDAAQIDLPEMARLFPHSMEGFLAALALIKARRDEASVKRGRLHGALSTSFVVGPEDTLATGRIVYTLSVPQIFIYAAHCDHDEAYRRARARYRR